MARKLTRFSDMQACLSYPWGGYHPSPTACVFFRRIAYQESTQTFGVISMRVEVLDPASNTTRPLHPSASTMAQNITTSVSAGMPGTSAGSSAGGRGVADGITFGDEVERSSLLIIDQHTFEGNDFFRKHLGPELFLH